MHIQKTCKICDSAKLRFPRDMWTKHEIYKWG